MILHRYAPNTLIVKEITQQIDLEILNKIINRLLHNRNELDKLSTVTRANRYANFIIITCYASLSGKSLEEFIELFLNEFDHTYVKGDITDIDLKLISSHLPLISGRKNSQCGGENSDSRMVDPNVAPLCDAINLFPGIKTFSSCEGHLIDINDACFYILFVNDTKEDLDRLTLALWNSLEKTYILYTIVKNLKLLFDYGHWPNKKCTYYELRINYRRNEQDLIFNTMRYLSNCLQSEINGS